MRQTHQSNLFQNQSTHGNRILENTMQQQMHRQPNMPTQIDKPKYKPIPPGFKFLNQSLNPMIPEPSMKTSHSNFTNQTADKPSNFSSEVKNPQQINLNPKQMSSTNNVSSNRSEVSSNSGSIRSNQFDTMKQTNKNISIHPTVYQQNSSVRPRN